MPVKSAARMIAVLALAATLTAAAIALRGDGGDEAAIQILRPAGSDYPRGELARCRALGAAALDDPTCRKAWADSRRHFLGIGQERRQP